MDGGSFIHDEEPVKIIYVLYWLSLFLVQYCAQKGKIYSRN